MKKALFIIALTCVVSILNAQSKYFENPKKTYVWATGGATFSSLFETYNASKNIVINPEFTVAWRTKYKHNFGHEVGVFYAGKGAKFNTEDLRVHLDYAGLYANAVAHFPLVGKDNLYAGAGIFVAEALGGNSKHGDSATTKLDFGNDWTRFDGGIEFRTGYEINNLIGFALHYDIGIFNMHSSVDPRGRPNKGRTSSGAIDLSVNLSTLFGKK